MVHVKKRIRWPYLAAAVCVSLAVLAVLGWKRLDNRPQILAQMQTNIDTAKIIGKVDGKLDVLLDSWSVVLWWKRSGEIWAAYSLDYESKRWHDVSITKESDEFTVKKSGLIVATLNTKTLELFNPAKGVRGGPTFLTKGDPLAATAQKKVYPESKAWSENLQEFSSH